MDPRLVRHPFGFWEIAEKPAFEDLQQYYADKYYQQAKGSYEFEYTEQELSYFQAKLEQRYFVLRPYLEHLRDVKGRFLDVGCGEGFALAFFEELGWIVKGIDFSSNGVMSKNPHCLELLTTGDIFSLLKDEIFAKNSYNIVWLQNVLEHVINPLELLALLRKLVVPDGFAVITVPNDCSITQKAALENRHIDNAFWVVPPDHLTYFDRHSLIKTVNRTGWDCLEVLADFPVDWYLFHPGSNYIRDKSVGKAAHKARVQLENLIHEQPIEDVIRFWSAAAKLGFGRGLTAFLRPADECGEEI
jgi:2-polyprenyl-3-methyl-5-hydroxy-6-metoxy-1,4-benzoquinol methylase